MSKKNTPDRNDERETLKNEIRGALGLIPQFTPDVIADFLSKIEQLEQALRKKFGPHEKVLCRERVDAMLGFVRRDHKKMGGMIEQFGIQKIIEALLSSLALQKEYMEARTKDHDELQIELERKFRKLRGVTSDQVCALLGGIGYFFHAMKREPTRELMRPLLDLRDDELQRDIDSRGADEVFPELIRMFASQVQKLFTQRN